MKVDACRALLRNFPQLPLSSIPTSLQPITRFQSQLTRESGPTMWIKRDDEIGLGLGGNKGRKLAYLLAEALAQKKNKITTFGGLQSNHARMTAASCAASGLTAHLFFFHHKPKTLTGNLLLNDLFGAKMHFIPFGGNSSGSMTLESTNRLVRLVSWPFTGPGSYFIPVGGHSITGCLGYVDAAFELNEQITAIGLPAEKTTIITAAGTGGTLAGLLAGFSLLNSPVKVLAIDIGKLWKGFPASIARLTSGICAQLGQNSALQARDVPIIENIYAGKAYAEPSTASWQAIHLLAQSEGIILDPVYTGKALAGLIDLVRNNHFQADQHLIFLHTGGIPALAAYE